MLTGDSWGHERRILALHTQRIRGSLSIVAIPCLNMLDGQVHDDERLVLPLELPHHRTAGGGRGGVLHLLKKGTC